MHEEARSGGLRSATNQRAELEAVVNGLVRLDRPTAITVFTDSEYVIGGFAPPHEWVKRWRQNGWRNRDGADVQNRDLWETLGQGVAEHAVTWWHVKGHARTYRCPSCAWRGDGAHRKTPKARIRFCPDCLGRGAEVRCEALDKYPLNARCDVLAGQERRRLLDEREAVPA